VIRFIVMLFIILNTLNASNVRWFSNFDNAHREALKQDKHMMILILSKEKDVLINAFMNQPYIEKINKNFISVIIVKNQKSSYPIELLYTTNYPALFFLNKEELFSCEPIIGEISPDTLRNHLDLCYN